MKKRCNEKYLAAMGIVAAQAFTLCHAKTPSVTDYLHDIDSARAVVKNGKVAYEAEVAGLAANPDAMVKFISTDSPFTNANKALATLLNAYEFKRPLSKCFGGHSFSAATTAITDHSCVDSAGFKR